MDKLSKAVAVALYWRVAYEDANPDVGMGPSLDSLLAGLLVSMGLSPEEIDRPAVLAYVKQRCG